MNRNELFDLLESKVVQYNTLSFIDTDPIQIPHQFSKRENIEISSFMTCSIAWGKRNLIIKNARAITQLMDNDPHDFILNAGQTEIDRLKQFKHRTFNGDDLEFFVRSLRNIYENHGGLGNLFKNLFCKTESIAGVLAGFRSVFFEIDHPLRTQKHVSNIEKGSACKRLNMMLRWLVRKDDAGVDFGIWDFIPMSQLYIPLDVHVGNIARGLGMLDRKQNDWQAVLELQKILTEFDSSDPCKYDFALFGMGVLNDFNV